MFTKTEQLSETDLQISFGWTLDALLSGDKTVTRRYWSKSYASRFLMQSKKRPVYASSNWKNGQIVGTLQIVSITEIKLDEITQEEVNLEGYPELTTDQFLDKFFSDRNTKTKPGYSWWRIEFVPDLYPIPDPPKPFIYDKTEQKEKLAKTLVLAQQNPIFNTEDEVIIFCVKNGIPLQPFRNYILIKS